MAIEHLRLTDVEHRGLRGDVVVEHDRIEFVEPREKTVKRDYAPQYEEREVGAARALALADVRAVERDGGEVRVRTQAGEETFRCGREADADELVRAIRERL